MCTLFFAPPPTCTAFQVDLISKEDCLRLTKLLKALNPDAEVIPATDSKVDLAKVLNTGLFSFEKAARSAGWLKSLQGEMKPETEEVSGWNVPATGEGGKH
jgi:G3E family GTPase